MEKPSPWGLVAIGTMIAICVGGGMAIGWLADDHFGTKPTLTLVGLAVGLLAAIVGAVVEIRRYL